MIFYFSGTGNSRWAAQQLAAQTGDRAQDIARLSTVPDYTAEGQIGLVFPVYAWGAPEPVLTFAETLPTADVFSFAVATCGSEAGHSLKKLSRVFPLQSSYSLIMPNNYILGADVDDEATARAKIDAAEKELAVIAQEVAAHRPVYRVAEGSMPVLKSGIVNFGFNKFARSTKAFYATGACNGCGRCARNCPAHTIRLHAGKPVWGTACYQCLRCLHECPQQAIQYGKGTETKSRYTIGLYRQA